MSDKAVSRRTFLQLSALALTGSATRSSWGQAAAVDSSMNWYDVRELGIEGQGWRDTAKDYDRLPARAEGVVPPDVWRQSRHSAGMFVRFQTDATEIWTDHTVGLGVLAAPDLAAIGMSGLDLYATDPQGDWKWLSVTRPRAQVMKGPIISGLIPGTRSYQLYLPLYNVTESLKIGIPSGHALTPIAPRTEKPIVFYGTSITQGASASRPGMPHAAILGRRLNRPFINLGFGGAGKMEPEVGQFLAELDPAVYVIDCLPNMQGAQVKERAAPLVRQLREAHPTVPIILVEDRTMPNAPFVPARLQAHLANRAALQQAYQILQDEGVEKLWYLKAESLLGEDREDTSDGSHPTDLGFWRQAAAFEPVIAQALGSP